MPVSQAAPDAQPVALPSLEKYAVGIRTAVSLAGSHPVPNIDLATELAVFEPGAAGSTIGIDPALDMDAALTLAIENAPSQGAAKMLRVLQLHVRSAAGTNIDSHAAIAGASA